MSWDFNCRYFIFGDLNTGVMDLFTGVGLRQTGQLGLIAKHCKARDSNRNSIIEKIRESKVKRYWGSMTHPWGHLPDVGWNSCQVNSIILGLEMESLPGRARTVNIMKYLVIFFKLISYSFSSYGL